MDVSILIASLALAVSASALALEIRRWVESGPNLYISIMSDAQVVPGDDGKPKMLISVTNRGATPTMITHCVLFIYRTPLHRIAGKSMWQGIVPRPQTNMGAGQQLPYRLEVNDTWQGVAYYDDNVMKARRRGRLYAGVCASHRDGTFLKRVPKKKNEPQDEKS